MCKMIVIYIQPGSCQHWTEILPYGSQITSNKEPNTAKQAPAASRGGQVLIVTITRQLLN